MREIDHPVSPASPSSGRANVLGEGERSVWLRCLSQDFKSLRRGVHTSPAPGPTTESGGSCERLEVELRNRGEGQHHDHSLVRGLRSRRRAVRQENAPIVASRSISRPRARLWFRSDWPSLKQRRGG